MTENNTNNWNRLWDDRISSSGTLEFSKIWAGIWKLGLYPLLHNTLINLVLSVCFQRKKTNIQNNRPFIENNVKTMI